MRGDAAARSILAETAIPALRYALGGGSGCYDIAEVLIGYGHLLSEETLETIVREVGDAIAHEALPKHDRVTWATVQEELLHELESSNRAFTRQSTKESKP